MSQSKDAGPAAARLAADRVRERERRLELLLGERLRLLGQLHEVEREIADLRREAVAAAEGPAGRANERTFSIRGEDAERGDFEPPPEIDAEDLRHCLTKVVLAARREGARAGSLELLVRFDPRGGRVRSIAVRKVGSQAWTVQLHRRQPEEEAPPVGSS
jgi:hypothetical protein